MALKAQNGKLITSIREDGIKHTPSKSKKESLTKCWHADLDGSTLTDDGVLQEIICLSPEAAHGTKTVTPSKHLLSPLRSLQLKTPTRHDVKQLGVNDVFQVSPCKVVLKDVAKYQNISAKKNHRLFSNVTNSPSKQPSTPKTENFQSKQQSPKREADKAQDQNLQSPNKRAKTCPLKSSSIQNSQQHETMRNVTSVHSSSHKTPTRVKSSSAVQSPSVSRSLFASAQKKDMIAALHSSVPEKLIGRDGEIDEIVSFVCTLASQQKAGSLYVSGAPGTGKSACLLSIFADHSVTSQFERAITVNCMSMRTPGTIYPNLAAQMGAKHHKTAKLSLKYIESFLCKPGKMILVLLDEMDQLDSKNQEVLYTMFGWTSLPNSRLVLVGVANSLDLTDRILPRLQVHASCKPQLMHFKPYSRDQLTDILKDRIAQVSATSQVLDPVAVSLCARKVAATTGDVRKVLDVCRRAVEMLQDDKENSTPDGKTHPRVGVKQVSDLMSDVYQSPLMTSSQEDDEGFPLQQKLVICSLIALCKRCKMKEVCVGKLFEAYCAICKRRHVSCLDQSEIVSLLHLLEARGLISLSKSKQVRQSKVKLSIQESDVEFVLRGKALLSSILRDGL